MTETTKRLRSLIQELKTANAILHVQLSKMDRKITELTDMNQALKDKIYTPKSVDGAKIELFIAKLVGGKLTNGFDTCDVISSNGTRFEVKFSHLRDALKKNRSITKRWTWGNILGNGGKKKYHRLILVGEADPRFSYKYCDPRSRYVIFDLPYAKVKEILGRGNIIQISSDPESGWSKGKKLLNEKYIISRKQLSECYSGTEKTWKHDSK